jgi:hypothetical protein
MRRTTIETEVQICATNLANKTKWMSTTPKKWKTIYGDWTMEKVQKPSNSECDTPSSEPFRIYKNTMC